MRSLRPATMALVLVTASAAPASNGLELLGSVTLPCGQQEQMEGVAAAVLSPDDAHLYVISIDDDTLTVFDHDASTGALTFNTRYVDGDPGIVTLPSPRRLAISPDGAHVYVTLQNDSVGVYARDAGTGALSFVEIETDGVGGVDGLYGALDVIVSPDGAHVYVAGLYDDAIAIFDRDGATGALTFTGLVQAGVGGVTFLDFPRELVLTSDGLHLYVWALDRVVIFSRNPGTGALTFVGIATDPLFHPQGIAVSPDGAHVYVSKTTGIVAFARDAGTGMLTTIETEPISGPSRLAIEPSGAQLYAVTGSVAGWGIAVFARDAGTGELTLASTIAESSGGVDGLNGVASFAFSADGTILHLGAFVDSSIATFERTPATGALTQVGLLFDAGPPQAAALSPDGANLYVVCARATGVLARDPGTGTLVPTSSIKHSSIPGYDLFHIVGRVGRQVRVVVAPDGAHVYELRSWAGSDQLEVFARDAGTGALTSVQAIDDAEGAPELVGGNGIAVSPDGEHVYVSLTTTGSFLIYDRAPASGLLTFVAMVTSFTDPAVRTSGSDVAVSPDGAHVYFLGPEGGDHQESFLTVLERDPGSGLLTVVQSTDQVPRIMDSGAVALSADGTSVYAGGDDGAAITALARDGISGTVAPVATVHDGKGGVQGLAGLRRLVVDPAGTHVYAASGTTDTLSVFRRDVATGALSFVEAHVNGTGGIDGLAALRDLVVSPDAAHLYVLARDDEAVTTFGHTAVCTPAPAAGCLAPARSRLTIKYPGREQQRVIAWKWKDTASPSLGDPLAATDLALCLYDASATGQPLVDALAPAAGTCGGKPCWKPTGAGVKYSDKLRTPDGLQKIKISPSATGNSTVVVKAKGGTIPAFSLPLTTPVTIQLQSSDAGCIEATFTTAPLNDGLRLVASIS